MTIPTSYINSLSEIHELVQAFPNRRGVGHFFRGQARSKWPLVPMAGRKEYSTNIGPDDGCGDLKRFRFWQSEVFPYAFGLPSSDFEALAYAQHHGLATRLLDWTGNPLVAFFFAVRELADEEGAVFSYYPPYFIQPNRLIFPVAPEGHGVVGIDQARKREIDELHGAVLCPRALDSRILNQRGSFTLHCPPERPLEDALPDSEGKLENRVCKFVIPASLKASIADHLDEYGINDAFIYPDADGVSKSINWESRKIASALKEAQKTTASNSQNSSPI